MDGLSNDQQFSRLDLAFSQFLAQRTLFDPKQKAIFEVLLARLSFQQSQGHSCIHLDEAEKQLVLDSEFVSERAMAPLKLEQDRLYFYRYWFYENRLAEQIKHLALAGKPHDENDTFINRYFIELIDETDWQREAAIKVMSQSFSIITGGPGTGKTTTVVKILALLQELAIKDRRPLHIALAAPTGKAAMRLQESIGFSKSSLPCSDQIKQAIPETVATLHRLLGAKPPSPYFRHDAKQPLVYDLVVIDEASMVDLALMSKLVDALKPGARLVLLGDKNQLASVESGAVLADLTSALPSHTVELKKSYRFQGDIKELAGAVNSQDVDKAWGLLGGEADQIGLLSEELIDYIAERYASYLLKINNNSEVTDIFAEFSRFQVLCSNRHGEQGVIEINRKVEAQLHQQNAIHIAGQWYIGRPIMVMQNNAGMQLYNGDIGLCLFDKEAGRLAVYFLRADGGIKKVLPSRVPRHETVFAMTIHKSQGSEFDECLCVLPPAINPVLTKELIYTAITRAKIKLKIAASYEVFSQALRRRVERTGGLFEKLSAKATGNK
jgi:exodeoxyribonuclease V alpha subunit